MAKKPTVSTPTELRDLLVKALLNAPTRYWFNIKDAVTKALPENICPDCFQPMTESGDSYSSYRCWYCYESRCDPEDYIL